MIEITTLEVNGIIPALHGMRNPKNSWHLGDSYYKLEDGEDLSLISVVGDNDWDLATRLANGGPVHAKYRRMITVHADITAPLYWWKELDTYRFGVEKNSCSTMHKIHAKEFTMDDFSHEHLIGPGWSEADNYSGAFTPIRLLKETITVLNKSRMNYLYCVETGDKARAKMFWWQMIQSLPSTYNQMRTVMMSYEALANICEYRAGHKLDEWRTFIDWAKELPCSWMFLKGEKHDV